MRWWRLVILVREEKDCGHDLTQQHGWSYESEGGTSNQGISDMDSKYQ